MAIEVARRAPVRSSTAWIRLLGRPSLTSDDGGKGVPPGLAGHKPWALLAYLCVGTQPVGRRELAEVLWPEAQDPAAAARWAIHQVRRALGPIATLADEHGRLAVRPLPGITLAVDALLLLDGRVAFDDVEDVVRGELLEGMELGEAPAFEDWLLVQRARTSSAASSTFRLAAVVSARTDPVRALRLVDRALRLDPYDDASHELAIRIEAERGASQAAISRADAATRLYATDLGVPAPATLRRSLDRPIVTTAVPLRATARALIQTARARFDAGDYAAAIEAAERAASAGAAAGDDRVEVSALVTLAAVLLHSIQGRVHEATGLLDRALGVATALHDERLVADIERELGYVGFLSGRYGAAESILARAVERSSSVGDASGAARSLTLLGACQSDRSDFAAAEPTLVDAVARLRALGDRWEPYAMAFLARVQLRTDRAEAGPLRTLRRSEPATWAGCPSRPGRWRSPARPGSRRETQRERLTPSPPRTPSPSR